MRGQPLRLGCPARGGGLSCGVKGRPSRRDLEGRNVIGGAQPAARLVFGWYIWRDSRSEFCAASSPLGADGAHIGPYFRSKRRKRRRSGRARRITITRPRAVNSPPPASAPGVRRPAVLRIMIGRLAVHLNRRSYRGGPFQFNAVYGK